MSKKIITESQYLSWRNDINEFHKNGDLESTYKELALITYEYQKQNIDHLQTECYARACLFLKQFMETNKESAEIQDMLADYKALAKEYGVMVDHFHHEAKPKRLADGTWVCPKCGARTPFNHSYCHKCGKRISWDKFKKK